jgi:hypothetical protein
MQLELKKNSASSMALLKETGTVSLAQCFPLIGAWFISLFGPVFLMGVGAVIGLFIDKMIFHLKDAGPASLLGLLVPGLLIGGFYAGWIHITLKIARHERVNIMTDLFRPVPQMFSAAVVLCLTVIAMAIPSALVVVSPILFLKFQLAPYYVVDQGLGPIESMKRSWIETNRIFIPLGILDLIFGAVSMALGFTLIVPFICFMVQGTATALVYVRWIMNDELDEIGMQQNVIELGMEDDR